LLASGDTVVVGVSGGPDSLCLLHILQQLTHTLSLNLHIAHLNHCIRGEDADADAAFVAHIAAEWQLPVSVESVDVPALARAQKLALEEAARCARYAFLARVAHGIGGCTIALAHNADDQTETVLMHWLRGSGLAGLRGMLPATQLADYRLIGDWPTCIDPEGHSPAAASTTSHLPSLTIIRPLLGVPRADIEAYCIQHDLHPRFDRSNLDITYFRNRLRHELIPYLETYNVNIRQVLRRSATAIAADYDLLRDQIQAAWKQTVRDETPDSVTFGLAAWQTLPLGLKRSTIRDAIHRLRRGLRNINFVHVENALEVASGGETGAQATLPQRLMLTVGYDTFTVADQRYRELPDLPLLMTNESVPVTVPGDTRLPTSNWVLRAKRVDIPPGVVSPQKMVADGSLPGEAPPHLPPPMEGWQASLDAASVGRSLILRPRCPGDRFCPLGLRGRSKRVNEFMINEKIPAAWREHIPLLVNEEGQILWICGHRPDHRARITQATQEIVRFRFERE
jgi:tRNA(Ile)-lysidine synthase